MAAKKEGCRGVAAVLDAQPFFSGMYGPVNGRWRRLRTARLVLRLPQLWFGTSRLKRSVPLMPEASTPPAAGCLVSRAAPCAGL